MNLYATCLARVVLLYALFRNFKVLQTEIYTLKVLCGPPATKAPCWAVCTIYLLFKRWLRV